MHLTKTKRINTNYLRDPLFIPGEISQKKYHQILENEINRLHGEIVKLETAAASKHRALLKCRAFLKRILLNMNLPALKKIKQLIKNIIIDIEPALKDSAGKELLRENANLNIHIYNLQEVINITKKYRAAGKKVVKNPTGLNVIENYEKIESELDDMLNNIELM